MKSRFFSITSSVLSAMSFFALNTAFATTGIEQRYRNASLVHQVVADFNSKFIPENLKTQLLDSARPEDKEFVKSMIINWKSNRDAQIHTEFDELILRDSEGLEVLRMRSLDDPQSFQINGRNWVVPTSGSISKSLRSHLEWHTDSASSLSTKGKIVAKLLLPSASLAESFSSGFANKVQSSTAIVPAYLFVSRKTFLAVSATEALSTKSPTKYVVPESEGGQLITDFMRKFIDVNVDVRCEGNKAVGAATLNNNRFQFESQADGTMTYTFEPRPGSTEATSLRVTSNKIDTSAWIKERQSDLALFAKSKNEALAKKILQDLMGKTAPNGSSDPKLREVQRLIENDTDELLRTRKYAPTIERHAKRLKEFYESRVTGPIVTDEMTVAKCVKPDCSALAVMNQISALQPWSTEHDQTQVDNALRWRPAYLMSTRAKIIPVDTSGLPEFTIDPEGAKLAKSDRELATRLMKSASDVTTRRHIEVRDMMLALQPLGSCCKDPKCRESLLKENLKLVPTKSRAVKQ